VGGWRWQNRPLQSHENLLARTPNIVQILPRWGFCGEWRQAAGPGVPESFEKVVEESQLTNHLPCKTMQSRFRCTDTGEKSIRDKGCVVSGSFGGRQKWLLQYMST
jgi:hypothetical protein